MCQPERKCHNPAWLVRLQSDVKDIGVCSQNKRDLAGSWILCKSVREIFGRRGKRQELRIFASYRGKPGVGVLKVRPGIPFEGEHALPVELVVVYSGKTT